MESRLDLLVLPDVGSSGSDVASRLASAITLTEQQTGKKIGPNGVREASDQVGVNKNFFMTPDGETIPSLVATLFNVDHGRALTDPLNRAVDGLTLLNRRLPEISNGAIRPERVIAVDPKNGIFIASFETDNVVRTPELTIDLLAEVCISLTGIKPDPENLRLFPHERINPLTTPGDLFEKTILGRLNPFLEWQQRLERGEVGNNPSEAYSFDLLNQQFDKLGVLERLNLAVGNARYFVDRYKDMRLDMGGDVGFHLGDGRHTNFLFELLPQGGLVTKIIDTDTAEFGSLSFLAAMIVSHPGNSEIFGEGKTGDGLRRFFLQKYAEGAKLDKRGIERLNILNQLVHVGWLATIARNMAINRVNWPMAMGGQYRNKAEFLINQDLPALNTALKRDPNNFIVEEGGGTITQSAIPSVIEKSKNPLTGESPIGAYESWIAQKVKDPDKHMKGLNHRLDKKKAGYPFTRREVFANSPYLISKTTLVKDVGDGILLVKMRFRSLRSKTSVSKEFGYITRTKEKDESKGGLLFVSINAGEVDETLFKGNTVKIKVPQQSIEQMLSQTINLKNPEKTERLKVLAEKLKNIPLSLDDNEPTVTDIVISPEHDNFFTVVTAKISDGREIPIKINRSGQISSEQAVGYVVRTSNSKYRLILNSRICTPQRDDKRTGKKEMLEVARAFSDRENPFAELSQELGMYRGGYNVDGGFMMPQSWETDGVTVPFYVISERDGIKMPLFRDQDVQKDEGWEELKIVDLTGQEIINYIQNNEIRDGFTIYSIAVCMLRETKELQINTLRAMNKKIALKREFVLQEGKDKLVIPRGRKDVGSGMGKLYPNSGSDRIEDEIRELPFQEYLKQYSKDECLEFLTIEKIVEGIMTSRFDIPTATALIKGLLNEGMLEYVNVPHNVDNLQLN